MLKGSKKKQTQLFITTKIKKRINFLFQIVEIWGRDHDTLRAKQSLRQIETNILEVKNQIKDSQEKQKQLKEKNWGKEKEI